MASLLSFYYTLKENTPKETIRKLVNEWVQTGQYYNFEEAILSEDELESAVRSVKGENQSVLSYCQAYDTSKKIRYLAFRLETKDASNLTWIADVIFSESETQAPGILISLNRHVTDPLHPADGSQRIKYPSLIKLLFDQNLVQDEIPLPLGKPTNVRLLTDEMTERIRSIFQKEVRTDFPLLFIHAPNQDLNCLENYSQENLDLSIQTILETPSAEGIPYWKNSDGFLRMLSIFSRVMHIYVADTEEDIHRWNQLSGGTLTDGPVIDFYYPWLNLYYSIPLEQFSDYAHLYQQLIMILQQCRLGLDPSFPDWNSLQNLITLSEAEDSGESYYLHMNQNIANAIQNRRKELHLTQGDLAEKVGTTKMLISRIERLQTIKVKRRMIRQLEAALSLVTGSLEKLPESDTKPAMSHSMHPAYCHMCGKALLSESRYCRWCGTKI